MIAKWIIVGLCALGPLLVISSIGKPRKPNTPGTAVASVVISAAEIVAILLYWK